MEPLLAGVESDGTAPRTKLVCKMDVIVREFLAAMDLAV